MKKIAFLDRDGTLNVEKNYLYKWEDFEWIQGAKEILQLLKQRGYILAVVSNQSGIARGYYTQKDVLNLHRKMNQDLFKTHGIRIDFFEFCPHQVSKVDACFCRKPKVGMFKKVVQKTGEIDKKKTFVIGDKWSDMEAGLNFNIKGFLVDTGHETFPQKNNDNVSLIHSISNLRGSF